MTEIETLREFLAYEPKKGRLFWRRRAREQFATDKSWATWNTRFAGKRALNSPNGKGYLRGMIDGRKEFAHRAIFALANGRWPTEIDHINGDKTDNRIENLREVSHAENAQNAARRRDNKTGVCGVIRHRGKFSAFIRSGAKREFLGRFVTLADAAAARARAELRLGFHKNHGRAP